MSSRLLRLWRENQTLRYLIVGGWNTAFGYGAFAGLYLAFGHRVHYLLLTVVSHVLAVSQSFATQRILVFRSRGAWLPEYLRFHTAQLGVLAFGSAGMTLLVEWGHLNPLAAQALLLAVVVGGSYFIHHRFTFRQKA